MSGYARTRDGRRLHYVTSGAGEPVVVLEAGLGATRTEWALVTPIVATRTAVLAYDRAGLGLSEPDRARRDHVRMAGDLLDLLRETGPCVLVGHSLGGALVERFARLHPERVAGLVLVDPSVPLEDVTLPRSPAYALARLLQPVGDALEAAGHLLRLATGRPTADTLRLAAYLPPDLRDQTLAELSARSALRATRAESAAQQRSLHELHELRGTAALPDVPITVITAGVRPAGYAELWASLADSHRGLVAGSPLGRHVVADGAGHLVPQDRPDLVAEEILRVVRRAA
ncbi:alpha/beta fold hydrolase [Nonomuraea sediminis]|uniref:alpha/beta fold hydrolase n=1 Tax=Nonomuraea sediminis TaxID=2835864 RepID=UPI001BDCAB25|nr:alpha/beta hydrolase [Nonomuraea sediminis]